MPRRISLWVPVLIYMAVLFWLSSLSHVPDVQGVDDKSEHVVAYLGLAVTLMRAFGGGVPPRVSWLAALGALAITVAYGASDEMHQMFVPGRTADVQDLYADAAGGAIGTVVCWAWGIISTSRHDL